jgi:hypothetical protein
MTPRVRDLPDEVRDLFFAGHPDCPRCGRPNKHAESLPQPFPQATCSRCWNEMGTEDRFAWCLTLMTCWMHDYRRRPIEYEPPHFQARYREFPVLLEQWRAALFEPAEVPA